MISTRIKPANKEVQLKKYTDCHNSFYFQTIFFLFQMDYVYNAIVYNHNSHSYNDRWNGFYDIFFIHATQRYRKHEPFLYFLFKFNLMIQSQNIYYEEFTKLATIHHL